jgi:tRNA pseudouridine55 synthase
MATGMLPICLDEATKVIADIESGAKAYEFTVLLGARTNTGDAEGEVVETRPVPVLDEPTLAAVLARFRGPQQQVPPMYSALKRDGKPLYELARQGIEVARQPRAIEIRRLDLLAQDGGSLSLACECTKGTYIRVLGEDIARALGTVGHLSRLRRTWVAPFEDLPMQSLESVLAGATERRNLLPPDAALQGLPSVGLSEAQAAAIRHGQAVSQSGAGAGAPAGARMRLYDPQGRFMGLAELTPEGEIQPRRLLRADFG